jgi:long-chain fatty acid transport protein
MKRYLVITFAVLVALALAAPAWATNGYQIIGIGQNQKSMGGAVTAAPMDAMTAITNPAGMARIGSRADFSIEAFMPKRNVDFDKTAGGDDESGGTELYGIPALGWTAPAFNRDDTYFGGGMYGTAGLGVDYGEVNIMPGSSLDGMLSMIPGGSSCVDGTGASVSCSDINFDGHSAIQFWKMAPTVAWNINDQASVGFALNLDYQSISITQRFSNVPFWLNGGTFQIDPTCDTNPIGCVIGQNTINFDLGRPTSQLGYGFTIGGLYDATDWLTLGAMYSSKQSFDDAEFRVGTGDVQNFNGATGKAGTYKMDLDFPQQAALGIAVKPIEQLLVAFDAKWIDWSSTHDEVDFSGPSKSFDSNGDGVGDKSSTTLDFGWDDQYVYALGIQYAVNEKFNVRTGYNYGKSPVQEEDVFNNLVFPAVVERHWTVGGDYQFGSHWGLGVTYMKAFKETVKGKGDVPKQMAAITPFDKDSNTEISLEETSVGMQVSYRF